MAVAPIPFSDGQSSGNEQLAGATPLAVNAFVDSFKNVRCRPVISTWSGFPATSLSPNPIVGISSLGSVVYCIDSLGIAYSISGGAMTSLFDGSIGSMLSIQSGYRPVMTPFRTKILASAGAGILSITSGGVASQLSSSAPMTTATAGIATRVVASRSDTSGIFQWSGLGDSAHATWDALNYAEAEAKPDVIKTIWDNTNEVYAFGTDTLQVFAPDPSAGFAPSRTLNVGILAPYSVIRIDDMFYFLDSKKRFVQTDGRTYDDKSTDRLGRTIEGLGTISDCWGFHLKQDQWDCCVWMFPTAGIGLVWDRIRDRWSEWRQYGGANGWEAVSITSAHYYPTDNLILVGLSNGTIGALNPSGHEELGNPVRVKVTTGFIDRGTQEQKHCKHAWLRLQRGQAGQTAYSSRLRVSYRDAPGAFSPAVNVSLGQTADYDANVSLHSLGVYRFRQWDFEYTGSAQFSLSSATEDFDIIGA